MTDKTAQYAEEIKALIKERTGEECKLWLLPQIEATAKTRALLDKVLDELIASPLLLIVPGSKAQIKKEAHPLLPYYDKLQRTLLIQYEALGLNFKTTPAKVREDARKETDKADPLVELLRGARELNERPL